jgi:periplasmic divalent cation tolerance protein
MTPVVVTTTVASDEQADRLADAIIAQRLAACVQIVPVRSVYHWQGRVERANECLLLAKTAADRADALVAAIRARHPYALPEILVQPLSGGLPEYLEWIARETHTQGGSE